MNYFEAIEAERTERENLIPKGFFDNRPEKSMEELIQENYQLLNDINDRKIVHSKETSDFMLDLYEQANNGYLPYCHEFNSNTSILNNMAYSTLIHEYNLWVLNDYLNDKIDECNFINMGCEKIKIDHLAGIAKLRN